MRALDKKFLRTLWAIRGQAFSIALVVAAAVATLVMSSSTYHSLELARDAYYSHNHFSDVFAGLKRAPDAAARALASIPGVACVQTGIRQYARIDMPGTMEPVRALAVSLPPQPVASALNAPVLRAGHWPAADADDQVLIHEAFAKANHLHPGDALDVTINGKKHKFIVSGIAISPEFVYVLGPGDLVPDARRYGILWMNRKALARAGNLEGAFNDVSLTLTHGALADDVIAQLDAQLVRYGGTGAYTRKDQLSNAFIDSELKQLQTMTRIMPPIFMLTAVFLLYIALGRMVETERRLIGLLKALGYSDFAVGLHYMKIALAIPLVGVAIGWGLGAWMGQGMTRLYLEYFNFPVFRYQITPDVFLGAAALNVAAALIAAAIAIWRAVRIPPAEAMLPPPPPVYHRGLGERLGLLHGVGPSGRMVLRHLARWPARAGFTVLGIALAVALLVSTLHFFDSIDLMLDSFFYRNNRQNVTLTFTDIRATTAASDIRHLPGVLRVELQRAVPARFTFGHLSKRVVLTGLDPHADLSRPLDIRNRRIFIPTAGIVLNERLAKNLGLRQGDVLRVRALEGRMPSFSVPVTGISREYIGLSAYMNRTTLDRLMRDGDVASTAAVRVDTARLPAFYAALKKMPFIAGVSSRAAAVALFRKLVRENIFVMITFYIFFASLLAFGVVFNNARLTLMERSREFSLLRVLGFFRGEVAWILGGEVALLAVFALPVGCLLGYGLVALIVAAFSSDLYRIPFFIAASTYGYAMVAILAATAVSGALVLYRLRGLDLLAVLKERE